MKTNTLSTSGINPAIVVLGILAVALVAFVLTGRRLPLLSSERAALIALVVVGMAMCSMGGIGRVAASGAWTHPFSILSYLLGVAILVIGIAAIFGKQIPPLTSYYQSFIAVAMMAAVKVVLTAIHRLLL